MILTQSCDRVLEIARRFQARNNTLNQENQALCLKLPDGLSSDNDNGSNGDGAARRLKRRRTRYLTPGGSDDGIFENESAHAEARVEDEFVNSAGHKFCIIYGLWVYRGADLFVTRLDETYDANERFENDGNKAQGQLQEILGLLKGRLDQDTILNHKWVRREVREFRFLLQNVTKIDLVYERPQFSACQHSNSPSP